MKRKRIKAFIGTALMTMFLLACSDILEEQPRSTYEPAFLQTERGIYNGINSQYAHLRYIFGQAYYYNTCLTGTDEITYAQSADENFKVMDISGQGEITPANSRADVLWGAAFSNINTASGIIENAEVLATIPAAVVAEARFFRAFDYFMLVQTFGGVPLDLGAGELKFNTNIVRTSVRNTVPEVYTKAIFPDLLAAINDLPVNGRVTGGVTKTVARLYLAKAYLTYAWWLENPKGIPTYPETPRTDPDGHNAQWYFQQAYDVAAAGIDNPGPFRLMDTYYDVNVGTNDRNAEILLYADHTESSQFYNGSSLTYSNGEAPENFAGWMMTWNYTEIRSASKADGTEPVSSVQREAAQALGRPWTRMSPTIGAIENTFADKTQDSRYDGTFVTVFRGNWPKGGVKNAVLYNANNLPVNPGDPILTFLNEEPGTPITYPNNGGSSNIGAGTLPGRADYVISPRGISRLTYPGLWKLGPYRTDNGSGLGQPNAASTRPFNIAKFSELYFIAAEAAVKGAVTQAGKSARELINVIRARAGKWRWDNNGNTTKIADHSADLVNATPAVLDVDYILAERSREYFGEGYRWYDLIRTQKWEELASTYEIGGTAKGAHTPATVTRSIKPHHYLRPIPQRQLDALNMSAAEKAAYQNPGYNN
ncbi:RagB/SusD family nutrient uptake outer membrane protein [Chryseosolibacter indicus]|uniref:RagB/SusD family nutrient uptake outer membrane protein n=1 Tax=Chryseosolibacter indicus TaxID=2782351 RepID=A0ABS5VMG9_9BACT|nr:RagB/SusD family nutrient uptake outer membrane protein [Chryseosolibacter indicus]MBT1702311.1 RagB/SusD family nutrient uptake outer membrane protein [Chryseosolibacter indicus]